MTDCKAGLISILPTNSPLCLTVLNKAGNLGHLDFAKLFARFELRPVRILNFVQFAGVTAPPGAAQRCTADIHIVNLFLTNSCVIPPTYCCTVYNVHIYIGTSV